MLVVSDATPLNVLIRLGLADVLARLYQRVVIPSAVHSELTDPATPEEIRTWMRAAPSWLVVTAPSDPASIAVSGAGEREAIALAVELKADWLLADDKEARAAARRLKVPVIGTIGILELAADSGWIDLETTLNALRKIGFFIDDRVLRAVLARHRARS